MTRFALLSSLFVVVVAAVSGCALTDHPTQPAPLTSTAMPTWSEVGVGPVEHDAVVSARWAVELSGLLDLDSDAAKAAGLVDDKTNIVLPVHVLRHPTAGTFVIDTGVDEDFASGGEGPASGLVKSYLSEMKAERSLKSILDAEDKVAGVILTHMHLDHVLGLRDVPHDVPVYMGPQETHAEDPMHLLMHGTYDALLDGRPALQELSFAPASSASSASGIQGVIDLVGDGSIYVLWTPGHTSGSLSVVARTTDGPKLFTGDTSHTLWGWAHGVPPGTFTADGAQNKVALDALKAVFAQLPHGEVFVGHELDGEDTGVPQPRLAAAQSR